MALLSGPNRTVFQFTSGLWVFGGPASILSAVTALIVDGRRELGILSLMLAVITFLTCGLPMIS
jgi:hypothetical protein